MKQRYLAFNKMKYRQVVDLNDVYVRVIHYIFPFKYLRVEFVLNICAFFKKLLHPQDKVQLIQSTM